jgi:hypothetical protein
MASVLNRVLDRLYAEAKAAQPARAALLGNTQTQRNGQLKQRIAEESYVRDEVDKACLQWIETGLWPKPKMESTLLHFYDRVVAATTLAKWLFENGFLTDKKEDELLSLFLILSWKEYGLRRLQSNLAHMFE